MPINQKINFYKMSGSGNDFIIIDNRKNYNEILNQKINDKNFVKDICDRNNGIGADGIILLENAKSKTCDFAMRIINSDGSEAEMCGNGARCFTYFAYKIGASKNIFMKFDTLSGQIEGGIILDNEKKIVKVKLTDPHSIDFEKNLDLPELGKTKIYSIDTGVPHAVIFLDKTELDYIDVNKIGSFIRNHEIFAPKGTNVNFVKIIKNTKHDINVRTFERGVEGETLSCGSGASASAIIASLQYNLYTPISVHTKSGETLKVYFEKEIIASNKKAIIKNVYLEGEIKIEFKDSFEV
ncbi:MAG: diaminopimelate epimerase [Elusimicrobiota bacterium]|nr:diaminopimelate epimerase [Elusimicrobiota bacterium]